MFRVNPGSMLRSTIGVEEDVEEGKGTDGTLQQQQVVELERQRQWLLLRIITPTPTPRTAVTTTVIDLSSLVKLDLPNCGLTSLPTCLPVLCPQLSILFVPKNKFTEVPGMIGLCLQLQMVSFKECYTIESISPNALQKQLRWLIVTGNKITKIPTEISRCTELQKLMLSGNLLRTLPELELSTLTKLELIRVACNQLQQPPILLLRNCPQLKWIGLAGNPFLTQMKINYDTNIQKRNNHLSLSEEEKIQDILPVLDDPKLNDESWPILGKLPILDDPKLDDESCPILGKGAGGVCRKVIWKKNTNNNNNRIVAVKTFAGELTSDGSPQDEKDISILVSTSVSTNNNTNTACVTLNDGRESALIEIIGETKKGGALVMEYLDNYRAVAGPPSMVTCSRDVYSDDDIDALLSLSSSTTTSTATIAFPWKIVIDTLRVLYKLHRSGVSHSDFYAHNILIQPSFQHVKVSDFGAAFRYRYNNDNNNDEKEEFGRLVEIIEVRAYSVFATELYNLTTKSSSYDRMQHPWKELIKESQKPDATFGRLFEKFKNNNNS